MYVLGLTDLCFFLACRIRVEHMERQLANLTGLVQKALTHAPHTSPSPRDYLQVPAGRDPYARGPGTLSRDRRLTGPYLRPRHALCQLFSLDTRSVHGFLTENRLRILGFAYFVFFSFRPCPFFSPIDFIFISS